VTRSTDLDDTSNRRSTALLAEQRAGYSALLELLTLHDSGLSIDPDRSRATALAAGRLLQSLASGSASLAALAALLRTQDCRGPKADAVRAMWTEVGAMAAETRVRYARLIELLRADQSRTVGELRQLGQGATAGYGGTADFCALLVDRSG
jgi:hypothetical protein